MKDTIRFLTFFFLIFLFAGFARAGEVTFQWKHLPADAWKCAESVCPDGGTACGYNLYVSDTQGGPYTLAEGQIPKGTNTVTLEDPLDTKRYVVVQAYNPFGESGDSNDVSFPTGPDSPEGVIAVTVTVHVSVPGGQ